MSVNGGPEYPATTDLSDVGVGNLALAEEPIAFDVDAIRGGLPDLGTHRRWRAAHLP